MSWRSPAGAGCGVRRPYEPPVPNAPAAWSAPVPQPARRGERLSRWWEHLRRRAAHRARSARGRLAISMCAPRYPECVKRGRRCDPARAPLWPSVDATGLRARAAPAARPGIGGVTTVVQPRARRELGARCVRRNPQHGRRRTRHGRRTRGRPAGRAHQPDRGRRARITSTSVRCSGASRLHSRMSACSKQTLELTQFRAQAGLAHGSGRSTGALERGDARVRRSRRSRVQLGQSIHAHCRFFSGGRRPS